MSNNRLFATIVVTTVSVWAAIGGAYAVINTHNQRVAATNAQAEAARIAADPLTVAALYNDVNKERVANGVPALSLDQAVNQSAQAKCDDMATNNYYDHINPTTQVQGYTYVPKYVANTSYAAEILNQGGVKTAQEFVDSWMNSPPHKAAMLDPRYTLTGFGICAEAGLPTVVEHFAEITVPAKPVQHTTNVYNQAPVTWPSTKISTYCNSQEHLDGSIGTTCY
jgi:uncharacterized protein YkwD